MKIKIFSIALFFAFFISNAQTNLPQFQSNTLECEYISNSVYPCETEFSHNTSQTYLDTFDPVVYNVFIWDIRNDQGGGQGNPLNEYEALTAVAELNKTFNEYKIFFKYHGFDIINNTTLYNILSRHDLYDAVTDDPQHPEWVKSNSFNIYIKYNMEGGGFIEKRFEPITVINKGSFMSSINGNSTTLHHEIGHCMGLHHTFNNFFPTTSGTCEHVTRNPSDPNYNADVAGDFVTDTAAVPNFGWDFTVDPPVQYDDIDDDCEYIGNGVDCEDDLYQIFESDVRNIMAYNSQGCKDRFSMGQGIRMRESATLICPENELDDAVNTNGLNGIASLYEPYKGEYFLAGPLPVDDDGNLNPPLFQPGFDYVFVDCDCNCPVPTDYDNINFTLPGWSQSTISANETDYSIITHPNHRAIKILQVGDTQPRRCYDNNNRAPSGGTIIKFNDNVLNTNVTITPQDSTSINDTNLINNLQPGLYNIIEQYEDGETEQQLIIKENN